LLAPFRQDARQSWFDYGAKKVARMFKRHLRSLLTFVRHPITTAVVEGSNCKIQEVKKRAYEFWNRKHFKTAIYFRGGGVDLYPETQ